ncbi:MAG: protoheme IX farnesyltransferase [Saprospiraceae bacterium]
MLSSCYICVPFNEVIPLEQESKHIEKPKSKASAKIADYRTFLKVRLASLVVFSAAITFALAFHHDGNLMKMPFDWSKLFWVVLGGFLVTGSSNGLNQIWERNSDKLMTRTAGRPLPQKRMNTTEGLIIAAITGIVGVYILWHYLNFMTGMLGLLSLVLYASIYTPMKKVSSWAVFVGAFPGAMPPMIGWVAYTGELSPEALSLFALQFIWQFPHFWAIAWRCHEDYQKAGFHLLPSAGGKDRKSAMQMLVYTLFMIPISLLPTVNLFGKIGGAFSAVVFILSALLMLYPAYKLFKTLEDKWATKLMFASFIYLPVVLIALLIDQLFIL